MKKFSRNIALIFTIISLFNVGHCFATEDNANIYAISQEKVNSYIIFSKNHIKNVRSTNEKVLKAKVLPTVTNSRTTIIIDLLATGTARVLITVADREYEVNANITNTTSELKTKCSFLEIVPLDMPESPMGADKNE